VNIPESLKYTPTHEWIADNQDGTVSVGVTAVAADQLGELVYVKLPEPGRSFRRGEAIAVVESTKAASDVYAPVSGTVTAANSALEEEPGEVNKAPYGAGWLFKLKVSDPGELGALLDANAYRESSAEKH
jgi:glycine cleavage system H protein